MSDDAGPQRSLKGTWSQAFVQFFGAALFILTIRWALFEPYVIPSGSMIPTLLVHDHIFVNKFAYGLRIPFARTHLFRWSTPARGEVVVFRSVEDEGIFFVKRVIGLPGDVIRIDTEGRLEINGKIVDSEPLPREQILLALATWPEERRDVYLEDFAFRREDLGETRPVVVLDKDRMPGPSGPWIVPQDHVFVMGDNRDNSHDSRRWGFLPLDHVLGRASAIWLSCEETLRDGSRVCDPKTVRWDRLFTRVR